MSIKFRNLQIGDKFVSDGLVLTKREMRGSGGLDAVNACRPDESRPFLLIGDEVEVVTAASPPPEIRRALIRAARAYCASELGSVRERDAWDVMEFLAPAVRWDQGAVRVANGRTDHVLETIVEYVNLEHEHEGGDVVEDAYYRMQDYVMLPYCSQCGIDGSMGYHYLEDREVIKCMVCGRSS